MNTLRVLGRDGWAGLAVLTASLVLFGLTLGLEGNPMVPIGPGFYPRIVLGVTAVLAAWLLIADWRATKRPPAPPGSPHYGLVAAMFALFGLYAGALSFLGFRLSTLLFVAAANALLAPPRGAKGWARVALIALLTTAVVYLAFERYLLVLLPRGRWTGF